MQRCHLLVSSPRLQADLSGVRSGPRRGQSISPRALLSCSRAARLPGALKSGRGLWGCGVLAQEGCGWQARGTREGRHPGGRGSCHPGSEDTQAMAREVALPGRLPRAEGQRQGSAGGTGLGCTKAQPKSLAAGAAGLQWPLPEAAGSPVGGGRRGPGQRPLLERGWQDQRGPATLVGVARGTAGLGGYSWAGTQAGERGCPWVPGPRLGHGALHGALLGWCPGAGPRGRRSCGCHCHHSPSRICAASGWASKGTRGHPGSAWPGTGVRTALTLPSAADPGPGGSPALEERAAQDALEALQLEKRLSLLSHSGRPGSGGKASAWPGPWGLDSRLAIPARGQAAITCTQL